MPIYETFAKRKRTAEMVGKPVLYTQDQLPRPFRVQVALIWERAIGYPVPYQEPAFWTELKSTLWQRIRATLATELGQFALVSQRNLPPKDCLDFLLDGEDVDAVLSLIELTFNLAEEMFVPVNERRTIQALNDAIEELNHRFLEHKIGYQYQSGQIISVESLYLHTEVVAPAIALLHDANFTGPLQEFMNAHGHYRKGEFKEAITDAGNAFESTMKAICDARRWEYAATKANASILIAILFEKQLIPSEMQSHFNALRSTLESGVPTIRNRSGRGAHGQGSIPLDVPNYLASLFSLLLFACDSVQHSAHG